MKPQGGFQQLCPLDMILGDPLISEEMADSSIVKNSLKGRKPFKRSYQEIRNAWDEARKEDPKITKMELARRLGLNISTVRGVLNRHKSYQARERRHREGGRKSTMIFAW